MRCGETGLDHLTPRSQIHSDASDAPSGCPNRPHRPFRRPNIETTALERPRVGRTWRPRRPANATYWPPPMGRTRLAAAAHSSHLKSGHQRTHDGSNSSTDGLDFLGRFLLPRPPPNLTYTASTPLA